MGLWFIVMLQGLD
ncbi:hypothetical protein MTR67_017826 [Solanum verrucosum]|uniref:Uncharacterized protein n=1 Tax=Solanum verrucosum TaxID=315347 RepID=A0AAF0TLW3_SOLVR|nr:hypothetical protein MTR67_017826 [Solanum verrucosum]